MRKMKNLFCYILTIVKQLYKRIFAKKYHLPFQMICGKNFKLIGKGEIYIEKGFVARDNCRVESAGVLKIGEGCFINNNVSITALDSIIIGKRVTIANNVVIVDHNHNYKKEDDSLFKSKQVCIEDDVWIGANVVILSGTKIGHNSVIGAGTVVRGTIPSNVVVYGSHNLTYRSICNENQCEKI